MVLREEETRAATAGQGNTSSANESTSLNKKAGLAHTTGDAAAGLGTTRSPPSTSTSCSMGAEPERNKRLLPLIRHKQEMNISNESRAHDPLRSSPGEGTNKEDSKYKPKKKKRSLLENPKKERKEEKKKISDGKKKKITKSFLKRKNHPKSSKSLGMISNSFCLDPSEPKLHLKIIQPRKSKHFSPTWHL